MSQTQTVSDHYVSNTDSLRSLCLKHRQFQITMSQTQTVSDHYVSNTDTLRSLCLKHRVSLQTFIFCIIFCRIKELQAFRFTIMSLQVNFRKKNRSEQTVDIQFDQTLKELSNQGLHCLQLCLYLYDILLLCKKHNV